MIPPPVLTDRFCPGRIILFLKETVRVFFRHELHALSDLTGGVAIHSFSLEQQGVREAIPPLALSNMAPVLTVSSTCLLLSLATQAHALPSGAESVSGDIRFSRDNSVMEVSTDAHRAIAQYQSFKIGSDETVNFNLPSAQAAILNRVVGGTPSEILGRMNSNGQVFLINPQGIMFGQSAQVNVGSLYASTLDMTDSDFMTGNYVFRQGPGAPAAITNLGVIEVSGGGHIVFSASALHNSGTITSEAGGIHLAVGDQVTVMTENNVAVSVAVDEVLKDKVTGLNSALSNSGTLQADGGQVNALVHVAQGLYERAINNEGVIQAGSLTDLTGSVTLEANLNVDTVITHTGTLTTQGTESNPDAGSVSLLATHIFNDGDITATGASGGKGGTVHVSGDTVYLDNDTMIDVSGDTGGGTILIGGDLQGQGSLHTASITYVAPNAQLKANALSSGDGGQIIVWADDTTWYYGNLSAQGGSLSGNGGFAEVSGKRLLHFYGGANLLALNGERGTLLLDPDNLYVMAPTLWLDANDSSTLTLNGSQVSQWLDKSGNNNHVSQGTLSKQPTYVFNIINGLPVLRFDGNFQQELTRSVVSTATTNISVFTMVNLLTTSTRGAFIKNGSNGSGYGLGVGGSNYDNNGNDLIGLYEGIVWRDTNYPLGAGPDMSAMIIDGSGGPAFYSNGTLVASYSGPPNSPSGLTYIGGYTRSDTGNQRHFTGDIAEVLIFNSALSITERQLVEQYFGNKYGISVTSPGNTTIMSQSQIETLSQSANVVLNATNNVTFGTLKNNLLNLQGNASLTVSAGGGVTMSTGDTIRTEGGAITMTGGSLTLGNLNTTGNAGNLAAAINLTATNGAVSTETVTSGGGNITMTGSSVLLNNTVNAGSAGTVTLKPYNASKPIRVASSTTDDTTYFDVTAAKLSRVIAGTLAIGDSALATDITMAGNIDLTGRPGTAGVYDLAFYTGGNFVNTGRTILLGRDAIYFDGSNDFISLGSTGLPIGNSTYALVAWIKPNSFGSRGIIGYGTYGSSNQVNALRLNGSNGFNHYWWSNDLFASSGSLNNGQWHHVVAQFNGTTRSIWLDGVQIASNTPSGHNMTTINARIGSTNGGEYFHGILDEVQVYNQALSSSQIAALYNNGAGASTTGTETGLVGAWSLNEGSGSTAGDASSSINTGTLMNSPTWVSAKNFTVQAGGTVHTGSISGDGSAIQITAGSTLTVDGAVTATGQGTVSLVSTGDLTLNGGTTVQAGASGTSLVLASTGGNIHNNAGANALVTPNGQFKAYSADPASTTEGGLTYSKRYNVDYGDNVSAYNSGNWIFYSIAPAFTVTADSFSRLYGENNPVFTGTLTTATLIDGDTAGSAYSGAPIYTTTATPSSDTGTYAISPGLGSLASSLGYQFNLVNGTLSVNKAPLTITTNSASRAVGTANPAFTASYSGFVLGQTAAVLNGQLGFSTSATVNSEPGTYTVRPFGVTSNNYTITFADGTIHVTADQTHRLSQISSEPISNFIYPFPSFLNQYANPAQPASGSVEPMSTTGSGNAPQGNSEPDAAVGNSLPDTSTFKQKTSLSPVDIDMSRVQTPAPAIQLIEE